MSSAKTHEFQKKMYTEIPADIVKILGIKPGDEVDFKNVYKDMVIITQKEAEKKGEEEKKEKGLTEQEIKTLKKIGSIRHYDRTKENIFKKLDSLGKKLFDSLFKRKVLFEYEKDKKKLIGISREYFSLITGKRETEDSLMTKLNEQGYLILSNPNEAKSLNYILKGSGAEAAVKGVRGFDKKFYIIKNDKLNEIEAKFSKALLKERILKDLANELGVSEELCKTAIEILKEDGSVVEKRRDIYVRA